MTGSAKYLTHAANLRRCADEMKAAGFPIASAQYIEEAEYLEAQYRAIQGHRG